LPKGMGMETRVLNNSGSGWTPSISGKILWLGLGLSVRRWKLLIGFVVNNKRGELFGFRFGHNSSGHTPTANVFRCIRRLFSTLFD
jgi:hypothetical protein